MRRQITSWAVPAVLVMLFSMFTAAAPGLERKELSLAGNTGVPANAKVQKDAVKYYAVTPGNLGIEAGDYGIAVPLHSPAPSFKTNVFDPRLGLEDETPVLTVSRNLLNFAVNAYGETTPTQEFTVRNVGGETLGWTVSSNRTWLRCTPDSGTNFGVVEVSLSDLATLKVGDNPAEILVESPGSSNEPLIVYVTVRVYSSGGTGTDNQPFGSFDSPENNVVVNGCVPLTGWALDDLKVDHVEILMETGTGPVRIGDATFIEGARPDIAQAFPQYPFNHRAGWGYLMLTCVLSDGPYVFRAVAVDEEGNRVPLGEKSIIINNASRVKPFGTIDFPAPGGIISGDGYNVFGWALPSGDATIPPGGVSVYVDSKWIGIAEYDIFRQDIYDLFPGYNNRDGAGFLLSFDSTDYPNTLHTIACVVSDGVNAAGIGSRFFSIRNLGTLNSLTEMEMERERGTETAWSKWVKDRSLTQWQANSALAGGPVILRRGFGDGGVEEVLDVPAQGCAYIELKELERIEVDLSGRKPGLGGEYSGYMVVDEQLWPLPAGSTLDPVTGTFYWQPGAGFLGYYQLAFVRELPDGSRTRRSVIVNVGPKYSAGEGENSE